MPCQHLLLETRLPVLQTKAQLDLACDDLLLELFFQRLDEVQQFVDFWVHIDFSDQPVWGRRHSRPGFGVEEQVPTGVLHSIGMVPRRAQARKNRPGN